MVVQNYFPQDIRVLKMAHTAKRAGHRVSVVSINNGNQKKRETVDDITVYRMALKKNRGSTIRYLFEYILFFFYACYKLNSIDRRSTINLVHINTLPDFLVFSALIQKIKGVPIILDMHEIWPEFSMSKFNLGKHHPLIYILRFIEKISLLFADNIITVNDPIKNVFHERSVPGKPISIVMNTVDESIVPQAQKRKHKTFSCVYHGTLTELYGLDIAIRGFAKACASNQNMTFNIFGDGQNKDKLDKLCHSLDIKKQVIFHGLLDHQAMMDALAGMDLGILAPKKDVFLDLSFSNKLAEYMFLRIPVVSSNLYTTQYYFNDTQVLFFKSGNIEDLSAKISFAFHHRDAITETANNAFKKIQTMSWTVMSKRYLALIDNPKSLQ